MVGGKRPVNKGKGKVRTVTHLRLGIGGLWRKAGTETLCAEEKEVGTDSELLNYL